MKFTSVAMALAFVGTLVAASAVQADVINVMLDSGWRIQDNNAPTATPGAPDYDNVGDAANTENYPPTGYFPFGDAGFISNAGYAFLLPALPAGQSVVSITFTATLNGNNSPANADLAGLRISPIHDFLSSDYSIGATPQSGTLLKDNWYSPGTSLGVLPAVDITSWVQSAGYVANDFVLLRAAPDAANDNALDGTGRSWTYGNADGDANRPFITITTAAVPEPASLGLLALGGLALWRPRR